MCWAKLVVLLVFFPIPCNFFLNFHFGVSKSLFWVGAMAHACNSSYLGGRDWEDHGLKANPGKKVQETLISTNEPGIVVYACNPSYVGGRVGISSPRLTRAKTLDPI
jgi:hypothetical protein